jgi:ubiquinone/menaquinone biosynthesis C-methylase UbiE
VLADAVLLPVRDGCLPAVITVMAHTGMPACPAVLAEAARVLAPAGYSAASASVPAFAAGSLTASTPPPL